MTWAESAFRVLVPATSANLGPGFDTLGLALSLHDEVEARVTPAGLDLSVTGESAGDVADAGDKHLVVRAMRATFDDLGVSQPPGLALRCVNRIPHGRGLGSSAAAIVAGILAARALAGAGTSADAALQLASDLEGHPDNVAPCLYGGLTIAYLSGEYTPTPQTPHPHGVPAVESGSPAGPPETAGTPHGSPEARSSAAQNRPAAVRAVRTHGGCTCGGLVCTPQKIRAVRLEPLPEIIPVAIIAPEPVSTELARGLLPERVPHADAARNAGRAALLIAALTARPGALLDATEDWLHQDYRAPAMPATHDLVRRLRAAGIPAVVSGAGPSVLVFLQAAVPGSRVMDSAVLDSTVRETGIGWLISSLDVERRGASVAPVVPSVR
jgi:homoserine kinase